jgi:hypothetical protein
MQCNQCVDARLLHAFIVVVFPCILIFINILTGLRKAEWKDDSVVSEGLEKLEPNCVNTVFISLSYYCEHNTMIVCTLPVLAGIIIA